AAFGPHRRSPRPRPGPAQRQLPGQAPGVAYRPASLFAHVPELGDARSSRLETLVATGAAGDGPETPPKPAVRPSPGLASIPPRSGSPENGEKLSRPTASRAESHWCRPVWPTPAGAGIVPPLVVGVSGAPIGTGRDQPHDRATRANRNLENRGPG